MVRYIIRYHKGLAKKRGRVLKFKTNTQAKRHLKETGKRGKIIRIKWLPARGW